MQTKRILTALLLPVGLLGAATWGTLDAKQPAAVTPSTAVAGPAQAASTLRFAVAPTGNAVRYRIRELLAGMQLPYDAVGETKDVTGALVFTADGRLVPAQSKVVVNVTRLTSDKERRDSYVQRRLLQTEQHPTVELAPTGLRGLSGQLPTRGTKSFDLLGNLTVRGVTRPTVWRVKAEFAGDQVKGTASTRFAFSDFEMNKPSVPIVLSLADTIQLEYDFTLKREAAR